MPIINPMVITWEVPTLERIHSLMIGLPSLRFIVLYNAPQGIKINNKSRGWEAAHTGVVVKSRMGSRSYGGCGYKQSRGWEAVPTGVVVINRGTVGRFPFIRGLWL